ncbi:serine hydrolase [Thermomonospora umbrina]|nr:serine hydrolase [Thermomonospora umbrina]
MRPALAAIALSLALVAPWTPAHAAAPGTDDAASQPCASRRHPVVARRLGHAITSALSARTGTEAVGVYDHRRGLTCWVRGGRRYDSASVVKVTVLGVLLRRAMDRRRSLTSRERSLARAMITRSDNDATSQLWRSLGRTRLQRFLDRAAMTQTRLGKGGYWGLTQITARDEIRLLRVLTHRNGLLNDTSRAYALKLMSEVVSSQRWGVPAGAPKGSRMHLKNGWLPRHGRYWRVHSIGAFRGGDRDYTIVVLTQDTPSMSYGIRTIERVARAVHRHLNPADTSGIPATPPDPSWETSDGSAVPEPTG